MVFLSHSKADKPAVEEIARRLGEAGIEAWLDKWNLIPGDLWQPAIEEALRKADSCVVFIGRGGLGSWQTEEMRVAINNRVCETKKGFRVIPVLLPGAQQPERNNLPPFLVAATWVIFRGSIEDRDAFHRLICGIRGVAPGQGHREDSFSERRRTLHNLPFPPNPAFRGRDQELQKLHAQLRKCGEIAATRIIAVHGLSGVGKTQLALEYAWKNLDNFDAVLWVKADSAEVFDSTLAALAPVLHLPEAQERDRAIQTKAVLNWLHRHEGWLLIVGDANSEEAVELVRARLPPNLLGAILITSDLNRWPPEIPDLVLSVLSPDDAARYLLERVAKQGHDAGGEMAAKSLACRLGNLPIALELPLPSSPRYAGVSTSTMKSLSIAGRNFGFRLGICGEVRSIGLLRWGALSCEWPPGLGRMTFLGQFSLIDRGFSETPWERRF